MDSSIKSGIYKVRNKVNGKCYYGSAVNFVQRFRIHRYYLRKGTSPCVKLQHAWNKYGEESFEFIPILTCDKKDLLFYEQQILDREDAVNKGYNICGTAGSALGIKRRPESIEKTASAHRGVKLTEEHKRKLSDAKRGIKQTPSAILARTKSLKGLKRSVEFCENAKVARQKLTSTAKLQHSDIPVIRALKVEGKTYKQIGELYNVAPTTICDIIKLRAWEYVA